jgi:hypothetical protein
VGCAGEDRKLEREMRKKKRELSVKLEINGKNLEALLKRP